jgi:hypothetical protein
MSLKSPEILHGILNFKAFSSWEENVMIFEKRGSFSAR